MPRRLSTYGRKANKRGVPTTQMNQTWWPVRDGVKGGLGYRASQTFQGGPANLIQIYIYIYTRVVRIRIPGRLI